MTTKQKSHHSRPTPRLPPRNCSNFSASIEPFRSHRQPNPKSSGRHSSTITHNHVWEYRQCPRSNDDKSHLGFGCDSLARSRSRKSQSIPVATFLIKCQLPTATVQSGCELVSWAKLPHHIGRIVSAVDPNGDRATERPSGDITTSHKRVKNVGISTHVGHKHAGKTIASGGGRWS